MLNICKYENYWGHRHRLLYITKIIKKNGISTLLDIGCGGGGLLTLPLMQMNPCIEIYGTDISYNSITTAKSAAEALGCNPNCFFQADINRLEEVQYDCVVCSEVLEHIYKEELNAFVSSIIRLTRPGGTIIITVPNGKGSFEKGKRIRNNPKNEKLFVLLDRISLAVKSHFLEAELRVMEDNPGIKMTESMTPHVNFFRKRDIKELFADCDLIGFSGSAIWSGCFATLIPPFQTVLKLNAILGSVFPAIASGFYFEFRRHVE